MIGGVHWHELLIAAISGAIFGIIGYWVTRYIHGMLKVSGIE